MIDIKKHIEDISISLKNKEDKFYLYEFSKIRFGVYLSFLKMGLVHDEDLANRELIENTPSEYLPCAPSVSDSFHLSTQTVRTTLIEFTPYIHFSLSEEDKESITDIVNSLPLTITQINALLQSKLVVRHSVTANGFCFLARLATGVEPQICRINPISSRAISSLNSDRFRRFEKPFINMIFPNDMKSKFIISLIDKMIRSAEKLSALMGVVDLDCITELPANKDNNNEKFISPDVLHSVLSVRSEFKTINGHACLIESNLDSGFIEILSVFVGRCGFIHKDRLVRFFESYFHFKTKERAGRIDKHKKSVKGNSLSTKVSKYDFNKNITDSFFKKEVVLSAVDNSGIFYCDDSDNYKLKKGIKPASQKAYWVELLLDFVVNNREKVDANRASKSSESSPSHIALEFRNYCADVYERELAFALETPMSFFRKDGDTIFIDDECIEFANNRRGDFIEPDASECDELSLSIISKMNDIKDLGYSNHDIYKSVFDSKWKKSKEAVIALYMNDDYVDDLSLWLKKSFFSQSVNFLRSDIAIAEQYKVTLSSRMAYIDALMKTDSSPNLNEVKDRIEYRLECCEKRVSTNLRLIDEVLSTPDYLQYKALQEELNTIKIRKSSLKITGRQFKAYLHLHDFIVTQKGKATKSELLAFIDNYIADLKMAKSDDGVVFRNNCYWLVSNHPFAA
ncbi:hypothetical protein DYL72_15395 [Vibrio anguillarum]|uniref:Uncharacterized protein n=1 Tax=Vibrio anguillarum TaxID=55601 RepID=A0A7U6FS33_VIBAN|nr:hypothetical protein [Vibrio anguillarum]AZS26292.1 hypothetical protein DYL72_15395 [Vibrio anguillarum]